MPPSARFAQRSLLQREINCRCLACSAAAVCVGVALLCNERNSFIASEDLARWLPASSSRPQLSGENAGVHIGIYSKAHSRPATRCPAAKMRLDQH